MLSSSYKDSPIAYQTIGTFAPFICDPARYCKYFLILIKCIECSQNRAASLPCFNDNCPVTESAYDAVPLREIATFRLGP